MNEIIDRTRNLPKLHKERILVVDDHRISIELLKDILANEGAVDGASNGKKALQKIGDEYYAAIITDVNMPVMDGIEFYNKAVERYPNIKERFLFISASLDEEYLSFFEKNNLRYFVKPVPVDDLRKVVVDIMTGRCAIQND